MPPVSFVMIPALRSPCMTTRWAKKFWFWKVRFETNMVIAAQVPTFAIHLDQVTLRSVQMAGIDGQTAPVFTLETLRKCASIRRKAFGFMGRETHRLCRYTNLKLSTWP